MGLGFEKPAMVKEESTKETIIKPAASTTEGPKLEK